MQSIQGIVTIVQEGRFQVVDADGVGHHFLLSHNAAVEPEQLPPLQREQALVRVSFKPAADVIGHVAERIDLLDREQPKMLTQPAQAETPATAHVREAV